MGRGKREGNPNKRMNRGNGKNEDKGGGKAKKAARQKTMIEKNRKKLRNANKE